MRIVGRLVVAILVEMDDERRGSWQGQKDNDREQCFCEEKCPLSVFLGPTVEMCQELRV